MNFTAEGHSPDVRINLVIGDLTLNVARIRGDQMMLREACDAPAGTEGLVLVTVDGREDAIQIILPEGIRNDSQLISYRRVDAAIAERS
jgi:hypothetical protein